VLGTVASFLLVTAFFSAFLNSGVHILMYTYYMLSAMGPQVRKYLWWKKYMTVIQLVSLELARFF